MPHANDEGKLVKAIRAMGSGLVDIPLSLWLISILTLLAGMGFLVAARTPSPFGWSHHTLAELVRDFGIALILAPVVTIIFEAGTRRSAKLEEMRDYINATMSSFVTKDIWKEIKDQVVLRNVTRRNVQITIRMSREADLITGEKRLLPDHLMLLEVDYKYDLYRSLSTNKGPIKVGHALDIHMWDEELQLPRFDCLIVNEGQSDEKSYNRDTLTKDHQKKKGLIEVDVDLPASEHQSTTIRTKRHELVSVPGMYTIVMPELMTPSPLAASVPEPTLIVTIEGDQSVKAQATTWFAPHEFEQQGDGKTWHYKWPMLAGQGFSIVFEKRPVTASEAAANTTPEQTATPGDQLLKK